jgi:glycosyltransferase involved in cell wall biosynthesis
MNHAGQTVCLNMIVRNEAPVIRRCLESVRPIIDRWVIVDTGSTDGTQDIIRDYLRDLPGTLHERSWVDFAHNRSEALALAKGSGDYIFVIDADEVLDIDAGFEMPRLDADSYNAEMDYGGCRYLRRQLLRAALPWRYEGVLHEYSICETARTEALLPGIRTRPHRDGARARDPNTYRRDALVLERALIDEPGNQRYVFYLAQSYRDAGEPELALRQYRKRSAMGGWAEEVWYSLYQIAQMRERMGDPWPEVMQDYLAAWRTAPDRAGPLYRIGLYHQARREYPVSHLFFARAMQIAPPGPERLFVEQAIYDYLLPLEYAVACFYVGDHTAAIATNNRLLSEGKAPPEAIEQVTRNRRFSLDALAGTAQRPPTAGPLHIIVDVGRGEAALDDCVDSLGRQLGARFRVAFTGAAATAITDRLALEDGRFALAPEGAAAYVGKLAASAPVLLLPPKLRLAAPNALERIRAAFDDPACQLAYGQHRRADGRLGAATPAPDAAAFRARGVSLADDAPFAARASLFQAHADVPARMFETVSFEAVRYLDEVWTIADPPAVSVRRAPASGAPLISCLMVTYDRLSLAKRAMRCFAAQDWPNKELVAVSAGAEPFRAALTRYAAELGLDGFRLVHASGDDPTLGHLRNLSLDHARGDWVCQWDDDDFSHPHRLTMQARHMAAAKAGASFMTDQLHYLADQNILCWVDWDADGKFSGTARLAPNTLMMRAGLDVRYPEDGPVSRRGEDSALLEALYRQTEVAALSGAGWLYLYQFHGGNTFPRDHHQRLSGFRTSTVKLNASAAQIRETAMLSGLARPCLVMGREGLAFGL